MTSKALPASDAPQRLPGPRRLLGLVGIYGGSRLLGLAREVIVAVLFGTTLAADGLSACFVVASIAGTLIGETAYAATLHQLGAADGTDRFRVSLRHGFRLAGLSIPGFWLVGAAVVHLTLGRSPVDAELVGLTGVLAVAVGASIVTSVCSARLSLDGRVGFQTAVQALWSLGTITVVGALALGGATVEPIAVALGWTLGNVAAAALLLRAVAPPRGAQEAGEGRGPWLRHGTGMGWSYAALSVQTLVSQAVAARLGTGRVAALGYADRLFLLPIGFVLGALGWLVVGSLTAVRAESPEAAEALVVDLLRGLTVLIVPAALLLAAVAPFLVDAVFAYGRFDGGSRALTATALDGLILCVAPVALSLLGMRVLQALGAAGTVARTTTLAAAVHVPLCIGLGAWLGLFGVTLSLGVAAAVTVALQWQWLLHALGRARMGELLREVAGPVAVAIAIAGLVIGLQDEGLLTLWSRALVASGAAMLAGVWLMQRRATTV